MMFIAGWRIIGGRRMFIRGRMMLNSSHWYSLGFWMLLVHTDGLLLCP